MRPQAMLRIWEGVFLRPNPVRGRGAGWTWLDPSGCSLLVLVLCHQPLPFKGGDVAGGDGSCWELCVGLVHNGAEAHNGLGFFFFSLFFHLVFQY